MQWRIVAQRLLHVALADAVAEAQLEEGLRCIADGMDGCLVSGIEQQDGGGDELVFAELAAFFLGADQFGQQIVARRLATLGDVARMKSLKAMVARTAASSTARSRRA